LKGKRVRRVRGSKNIRSTEFIKIGIGIVIVIKNNTLKILGRKRG